MAYTDGSKVDQKNKETGAVTQMTGTGIYVPKQDGPYGIGGMMGQGKRTSLRPSPPGYTNPFHNGRGARCQAKLPVVRSVSSGLWP